MLTWNVTRSDYVRTYATAALADAARQRQRGGPHRPSSSGMVAAAPAPVAESTREGEDTKMEGSDEDEDDAEISDAGSFDDD